MFVRFRLQSGRILSSLIAVGERLELEYSQSMGCLKVLGTPGQLVPRQSIS